MEYVVITYLCLAILLYFLLGGADFGVGIVEMFTSTKNIRRTRNTLYHAIGPIWEANHMWLIIAVVILFVGFPLIYSQHEAHAPTSCARRVPGVINSCGFQLRTFSRLRNHKQWKKSFLTNSTGSGKNHACSRMGTAYRECADPSGIVLFILQFSEKTGG